MLDHVLNELLLAYLKTVPALAALHDYTGQDSADHKLPALTVSTTSAPLAGSDTAFRGEVGVIIESEAHDTTAAAHGERVEAVRAALANRAGVIAALNATGRLHIRLRATRLGTHIGRGSFQHEPQVSLRLRPGVN
jgi:hypothetical protein